MMIHIRKRALVQNLIIITFLVLLPVVILSSLYYYNSINYIREQEIQNDTKFLSLAGQSFDTVLNDITYAVSLLEFDIFFNEALEGLIEDSGNISPTKYIYLNSVWENTSRALMAKPYISSAYFYVNNNPQFVFTTQGIRKIEDLDDTSWLDSYVSKTDNVFYWTEIRKLFNNNQDSNKEIISIFRKVPVFHTIGETKGVVVVNINQNYFDLLISNIPNIENKKLYILDDKSNMIYRNSTDPYELYIDETQLGLLQGKESAEVKKIGEESFLVSTTQSGYYGWRYISVIPMSTLMSKLTFIRKASVQVLFISLLIGIFLSVIYTLENYRSVKTLTDVISQYEQGKDISQINFKRNNEYKYIIYNVINNFIEKNEIEKVLTEEKLLQKETQLYALQSQINPHLLYNILDTINWEAINLLGIDNNISKIILNLADNLRYITNHSNNMVSFAEDLKHLKSYSFIYESLYSGRIKFLFQISYEVLNFKTLKLLIQPLVENAVVHGLADLDKKGVVKISVKKVIDVIRIKVVDNGCGISRNKLNDIRKHISRIDASDPSSLGLKNVHHRIKLHYGDNYGLNIRSKRNWGTAVYLTIPTQSVLINQ